MSYAFNLAKPNRLVKLVNVNLNGDNPSLTFSSAWSEMFVEGSFEVFYCGRSNDTLIKYKSREKKMENQEFIDVLITDLELLLNEVSDRLDEFNVTFRWCGVEEQDLEYLQNVYDQLALMTSHKKINACSVGLSVDDIDQVRFAYTCFDLQTLRHCGFHFVDNQFEDPVNALKTICEIGELKFLDSIEAHFKVENLSNDDLVAMKKVVMDSGRKCKAVIDNTNGNNLQNEELTNIFGDSIEKYQEWIICRCENLKCYIYESRIEIQTKEWKSTPREKRMRNRRMGACSEDSEDEHFKLWRESMDIPKRETSDRPSSDFKNDSSTKGASSKDDQPSTTEDETSELRRKWKTIPERDFDMMLEFAITQHLPDSKLYTSSDGASPDDRHSKSSESNINNQMLKLEAKRALLFSKDNSSNIGAMAKMYKSKIMQDLLDSENDSSNEVAGLLNNLPSTSDNRTPTKQRHLERSVESLDNIMLDAAIKQSLLEVKGDFSADGTTRPEPNLSDNKTPTNRERSESSEENSDNIMLKYAIELSFLDSKEDASEIEAITKKLKLELTKLKLGITQSLSDSKDDSLSNEANLQNDLPSTSDSKTPTSRERSESSESNISNILRKLEIEQSLLDSKNDSSNPESMMKMLKLDLAKLKLVFFQAVLDAKGNSATDETRPEDVPSLNSEGRNPTSRKLSENFEENSDNIKLKYAIELSLLDSKKDSSKIEAIPEKLKLELAKLKLGLMKSLSDSKDDPSINGASLQKDLPSTSDDRTLTSRKRSESSEPNIENKMIKLAIKQSLSESKDDSSSDGASLVDNLSSTSGNKTPISQKLLERSVESFDNMMLELMIKKSLLDEKGDSSSDGASPEKNQPSKSDNKTPTSGKRSDSSTSNIGNLLMELAIKQSLSGSEEDFSTGEAMAKMLKLAIVQSLLGSEDDSSTDGASPEDDLPFTSDNKTSTSGKCSENSESNIESGMMKLAIMQSLLDSKDDSSTDGAGPEDDLPSTSDEKTPTKRKRSESSESSFDNFMLKLAIKTSLSDLKDDSLTNGASPEDNLLSTSDNKTPTSRKRSQVSESNINNKIVKFATIQSILDSIDDYSIDGESPEDDLPSTSDKKTPTSRKRSQFSESNINSKRHKFATMQSLLDSKVYSSNDGGSPEDDLPSTSQIRSSKMQRRSEIHQQDLSKFHMLLSMAAVHSAFDSRNTSNTEAVPDNDPDSEDSRRHKEHFQNFLLNVNNMIRQSGVLQNSSDLESDSSDITSKKEQNGSSHRALTNKLIMSLILQRVGLKTISSLRQVSWGIRRCVDGIKSDSKIEALAISLDTSDRVKIEVTDKTIHKAHVFQTVYNDSYKKFWDDKKSMNMNDEYTYPSYELYHFPNNTLERGHYYPLATAFSKSSKQNVIEWYQKRLCSFSYELRHNLLNQRKPIESFSLTLPWFIKERGNLEFYLAGYHFISMFGHEVPMYTKFLDLKIESRACEHCRKTDEVRNLASCDVHQRMFRELLEENREICGPNSGHPDYQNRPITYTQDEYVQRVDLFVRYFEDILSSVGHKIPVEALYMQACNQNTVLRVLRHLDPRSLKTISIKTVEDDQDKPCNWVLPMEINEICELDQWKCAKNIEVEHLIDTDDVRHFGHFSEANVKLTRLTMAGILILKTAFLDSHNFIKFKASFETSDINEAAMLEMRFQRPNDPNTNNPSVWYFKFLHSSDYLHVLYNESRRRIVFTRREAASVPANLRA